jgi:hypothetical protein
MWAWIPLKQPYFECVHIRPQVIKRKKEEANNGNKNYIESSVNPEDNSVTTAFKGLRDDLDEQDENDVGKQKIQLSAIIFSGTI